VRFEAVPAMNIELSYEATKREPSAWGYNRATLFLGIYIRGAGPPGWGSLESETVKYVVGPTGLGPDNDCAGEAQQQL
jgi:hypothetical protein